MKEQMTPKEFMDKCEWEGGGLLEGFEYGLTEEYLDNSIPEFKRCVKDMSNLYIDFYKKFRILEMKSRDFFDYEDIE